VFLASVDSEKSKLYFSRRNTIEKKVFRMTEKLEEKKRKNGKV
jgi:hypothetical protein